MQSGGRPLRVFYAFDPRRTAILLIGGDKTGDDRFCEKYVPIADKLYDTYLGELLGLKKSKSTILQRVQRSDPARIDRMLPLLKAAPRWIARVAIPLLTLTGNASACPICLSGFEITPGQKIDLADDVVLAAPTRGWDRLRVVEVIKGDLETGSAIVTSDLTPKSQSISLSRDTPAGEPGAARIDGGKSLLLIRDSISERWTSLGMIAAQHAMWLRRFVESRREDAAGSPSQFWPQAAVRRSTLSDEDWAERMVVIAPHLESEEPLAAEIAFGELARAPYGAMRSLEPVLEARKIWTWIDDRRLARRHAAYILLLGIAGGPDDATALERRIAEAWSLRDATGLSAMLAADLELRGPSSIASIESMYFVDGDRTLAEIQAALTALSVHGSANGTIPRKRIIDAYRSFIRARMPMAGFVAGDLADWEAWEATADYLQVARSNAVKDPAGRFAIAAFLQQSPNPAARAALDALGVKAGPEN